MKKRIIEALFIGATYSLFGWFMYLLGHYAGRHVVLSEIENELEGSGVNIKEEFEKRGWKYKSE